MGNVLDCSTDPLEQIIEPDVGQPGEVGDVPAAGTKSRPSEGGKDGGDGSNVQRERNEILYLERSVPLRDSIMWNLQRQFYKAHHVQCWEKMVVPCFVTSNCFIARAYARILVAFMRDWFLFSEKADQSEPMLILEVGAGHGKFSCLVLQQLLEMREFLPSLSEAAAAPWQSGGACDGLPFRYVVTDVAQGTLDFVRAHSSMQDFLEQGLLEVALFDAEEHDPTNYLHLQVSGKRVDLSSIKNPMAVVCNYVFDSLQQDAFRVKNKTLYENRVSITSTRSLPQDISHVSFKREDRPSGKAMQDAFPPALGLNSLQGLGLQWEHFQHPVDPERAKAYYNGVETGMVPSARCGVGDKLATATATVQVNNEEDTGGHPGDKVRHASNKSPPPVKGRSDGAEKDSAALEESRGENGTSAASTPAAALGVGEGEPAQEAPGSKASVRVVPQEGLGALVQQPEVAADEDNVERRDMAERTKAPETEDAADNTTINSDAGGCEKRVLSSNGDSDFDGILAEYIDGPLGEAGGSLLVPLGGLRLLRRLSSLCCGRCLVLVGDKGYASEQEMSGQRDPHIAYHGSLSCMVNMDALGRYTRRKGGWSMASPYMEGFKCQALAFGMTEGVLQETRLAFEDATQVFGPESFSTLQRTVKDEVAQPSVGLVVQLLRASMLDPDVFMKFRASLVEQVSSQELPPSTWEDLKADALAIADRWYPLQQGKDVNFEAARLLMALKDFESAVSLFRRSERESGEHHVTCHNMGMSFFYLGEMQRAKDCFERSLQLNETYEDSVQWLAHLRRTMPLASPSVSAAAASDAAAQGDVDPAGSWRPSESELRDAALGVGEPLRDVGEFNVNTLSI